GAQAQRSHDPPATARTLATANVARVTVLRPAVTKMDDGCAVRLVAKQSWWIKGRNRVRPLINGPRNQDQPSPVRATRHEGPARAAPASTGKLVHKISQAAASRAQPGSCDGIAHRSASAKDPSRCPTLDSPRLPRLASTHGVPRCARTGLRVRRVLPDR